MTEHKSQPAASDVLESVNALSDDKRALLARRLREKSNAATSDQHKPEQVPQHGGFLSHELVERFRACLHRRQTTLRPAQLEQLLERVREEVTAFEGQLERGEITNAQWTEIRITIRSAIILLLERYPQETTLQRLGREFLHGQLAHTPLKHPKYTFTHDVFTMHIEQWQRDFGYLRGLPNLRFLEIGSFEGWSTCWLLENILTHPTSTIICIDPFNEIDQPRQEAYFDHNIEKSGAGYKVTKLRGLSQLALRFLTPNWFDFIYIDGSHAPGDILQDAILAWELLKRKAFLVFDDYEFNAPLRLINPTLMQPKQAIDAFLSLIEGRHTIIHKGWQVALRKL